MATFAPILSWCLLLAAAASQSPPAPDPDAAFHQPYGAGCYEFARESFYVLCDDAAGAATAFLGRSLRLSPTANGYAATWGGGTYRAPTNAAFALPPSDDGQVAVALTQPFPMPGGATSTLWVHSNGIVACGPGIDGGLWNTPPNDFTPSPALCNAPDAAFFAWHDWNPAEPGSGRIKTEEVLVAGERVLCITWHDVENFPAGVTNRGTFQFQFGLGSGQVTYVWVAVDANTASPFSTAHLVGWSPGGASLAPAPLAVGAPVTTSPDARALELAAFPPPVSSATSGTLVRHTVGNTPELVAGSTVRIAFLALALASAPGVDLAAIGAPGCRAYLQSLDLTFLIVGTSAAVSLDFAYPPALPVGLDVFAQAIALVPPQSWGGADNTLGLVTSNGLRGHVDVR